MSHLTLQYVVDTQDQLQWNVKGAGVFIETRFIYNNDLN